MQYSTGNLCANILISVIAWRCLVLQILCKYSANTKFFLTRQRFLICHRRFRMKWISFNKGIKVSRLGLAIDDVHKRTLLLTKARIRCKTQTNLSKWIITLKPEEQISVWNCERFQKYEWKLLKYYKSHRQQIVFISIEVAKSSWQVSRQHFRARL